MCARSPTSGDISTITQKDSLLGSFAHYLDRDAIGAVVAGPASAAANGGLIDVVRNDKTLQSSVSTVDGVDTPSGVIATIFAAAEQASGRAGSYGVGSGAGAPLPTPSP